MSPVEFLEQEYIKHYKGVVKISMLSSIVEAKQMEQSLSKSAIANNVCGACDGSKKFMNSDCNICKGTGKKPQADESCPGINGITDHGYIGQSVVKPSIFLFSGLYAGEKFEIKIKAVDKESAIADFESTWIHHRWHIIQEIS